MQEVYWRKFYRTVHAVNSTDELVDAGPEVLIFLDILARWHGDLNKYNFASPLGMLPTQVFQDTMAANLFKEDVKCMHLLRDALNVIKPIHADDNLEP